MAANKVASRRRWIRFLFGLSLFILAAVFLLFTPVRTHITFDSIVQSVESARHNTWSGFIFFGFFAVAVLALPITLFPIIGGVLFPFWAAFPLNLLAAVTGAYLAFALTRFFGRDAIETLLKGRLRIFDRVASVQGLKTVLALRFLGIPPFLIANYALGLSGIRTRDYLVGTILGIAPWMALMTFTAHTLWEAILVGGEKGLSAALVRTMGPMMILSLGVVISALVVYRLKRRRPPNHSNL